MTRPKGLYNRRLRCTAPGFRILQNMTRPKGLYNLWDAFPIGWNPALK